VAVTAEDWEGTWAHKDGAVTVAVTDGAKGLLEVGWVEKRSDGLVFERHQVWLRKSGPWMFGSAEDVNRPSHFVWGCIERDGDQLILWTPNSQRIKDMVAGGELRGRPIGDDVLVTKSGPEDLERIMSLAEGAMNWQQPLVFSRIAK
jgi:hypothetical protein